jgi:hypothetical protein
MARNHIASTFNTFALAGLLTLVGFAAAGCIAVGGSDNYTAPTLGRQLQDLKTARDTGAVTDAEYQDAKNRLITGEYNRRK